MVAPLHQHLHSSSSSFRSLVPEVTSKMPWYGHGALVILS